MASTASKFVAYEEWLRMPAVDGREEVVDGEIIKMPPTKWNHSLIVHRFRTALLRLLHEEEVLVITTVFALVIREEPLTCHEPDLAIFIRENIVEPDGYIRSAPELIVEVLAPANTRKDMVRKAEDYETIGVPKMWILSPEGRTLEVLQLHDGKLGRTQVLADGRLRPVRFPETIVDVASVWPD